MERRTSRVKGRLEKTKNNVTLQVVGPNLTLSSMARETRRKHSSKATITTRAHTFKARKKKKKPDTFYSFKTILKVKLETVFIFFD
jgi:hypothetical protein